MLRTKCSDCGLEFPINDTFELDGNILCAACAQKAWDLETNSSAKPPKQQIDPTICFNCSRDNQDTPLPTISSLPTCEKCQELFRNYPFPDWIKVSAIVLLGIVIFSFIFNGRFILAFSDMKRSNWALGNGNLERGADLMASASKRVPENEYLNALADFYRGVVFLKHNQSAKALELFTGCKKILPPEWQLDIMIDRARIGVAFEDKDYDKFLELAHKQLEQHPNEQTYVAQVASAYACKYALTGDEEFKIKALEALNEAERFVTDEEGHKEYKQRILHRIHTREIIDSEEFYRRYPNGWQLPEEQQK